MQKSDVCKNFDPKDYTTKTGLSEHEIIEIKDAFDLFDADKSGSIDPRELKMALEALGLEAKSETIYQMLDGVDHDKNS